jgi:acetylornithine deacetylase
VPTPSRIEQRLADLVAFDTQNPGGSERALADKLAVELRALGADVERFDTEGHASVFGRFGARPRLLLNAHLDTVPANSGYTSSPLQLVRRGTRLHGLGAADTKGSAAAIMEALTLRASRGPIDGVAVLFSGDEEKGGVCIRDFLASERSSGLERVIVGEPTGCRVGRRHRGLCAAELGVTSPGGHSSLADRVPNPVAILSRVAVALEQVGQRYRLAGPLGLQGICMNLAAIEGGVAFNVIPTRAKLVFSVRPGPGVDHRALLDEIRRVGHEAAAPAVPEWRDLAFNPPFETRDLSGFATLFGDRMDSAIDLPYGTEAGQFVERRIDAVVFGPGRVEQAHAADEFVESAELEEAVQVILRMIS